MARVKEAEIVSRIFLVEGKTDVKIIRNIFERANCRIFNAWELDFKKIEPLITASSNIFLVLDMDNITPGKVSHQEKINSCKSMLIKNLKKMAKMTNVKKILVCPQYFELEDEIVAASNLRNIASLYRHFGAIGERECKDKILNCTNLKCKLEEIEFNRESLWGNKNRRDHPFFESCKKIHAKIRVGGIDLNCPHAFL